MAARDEASKTGSMLVNFAFFFKWILLGGATSRLELKTLTP